MGKYIKLFQTHAQYQAFTQTEDFVLPNVSYCEDVTDEVHYNPYVAPEPPETRLVVTFNCHNTSWDYPIHNIEYHTGASVEDVLSEIEVDGVVLDGLPSTYRFSSTGEHTVKYTLIDNTTVPENMFYEIMSDIITSIYLPSTITYISQNAFASGYGSFTSSITIMAVEPPSVDSGAFTGSSYVDGILYVPTESIEDYENYFLSNLDPYSEGNWTVQGI